MTKFLKIFLAAFLIITSFSIYFVFIKTTPCLQLVQDYVPSRDRQDVINLFKQNWYWLIASSDFSTEFMLDRRAPDRNPRYMGTLHFKVIRINNELAAFTAFYMKKNDLGRILFLVVDEKHRSKGYADTIMRCTMEELKKMGATKIILLTRESNAKAQRLYLKLGFSQYKYDPSGFVHFEYYPEN